jgi:hypothetical protein
MQKSKCRFSFIVALWVAFALAAAGAYAADKVIYFTAGDVPTTAEKAAITTLSAQAAKPYTVSVRSSRRARLRATPETTDYVAGAIPPNYRDGGIDSGTSLYTVYSITNPPDPATLPSAQAILRDGDEIALTGGGSVVVAVSGNTVTVSAYIAPDGGT